jgi:molybdenum cofactor biosynthesis protein MoaC
MIDVSPKFNSLRYAKAEGYLYGNPEAIARVADKTVPKGDVLEVARAAGITAAKRCSDMIVFCHPIPLDWVGIDFEVEPEHIRVIAEVRSVWKTGVEVEAITGVTGALLNAYDMLKPLDAELSFGGIRVMKKRGGKNDFADNFKQKLPAAVLVISDSTFVGKRKDRSGRIIQAFLKSQPVAIKVYEVLPDDDERIAARLRQLIDDEGVRLVFTTGGTGLGPRDLTPEATSKVINYEVPGIAEAIRRHGKDRTPYAMLSRELVGVRGEGLIINLPGSSTGAKESLEAIFPGVLHAFPMMAGVGHGKENRKSGKSKEGVRHD